MNSALNKALHMMLMAVDFDSADEAQRRAILVDLLWKLIRKDYHGVADCAMDLRELHL